MSRNAVAGKRCSCGGNRCSIKWLRPVDVVTVMLIRSSSLQSLWLMRLMRHLPLRLHFDNDDIYAFAAAQIPVSVVAVDCCRSALVIACEIKLRRLVAAA